MSEIYSNITGDTPQNFLSFALPILTIANIISIIFGAMSHKLGQAKPEWTGEGELVRRGSFQEVSYEEKGHVENKEIKPTLADVGAALAFGTSIYLLGRVFSSVLLPTIFGIQIHAFAYMVLFMAVFNMTNIVPENIKAGAKRLMKFFTGQLMFLQMFAVGVAFGDFEGLVSALTIPNLIICFAVVVGAYVGSALVGYLVGFYPIESAISAGLCMANRGGSGDIAVLGAAKRMNLMSFAQISSRLGGGIMLFIASVVFSFF